MQCRSSLPASVQREVTSVRHDWAGQHAYNSTTNTLIPARSTILPGYAGMAKLVDASDLKSAAARRAGSIPAARTTLTLQALSLS